MALIWKGTGFKRYFAEVLGRVQIQVLGGSSDIALLFPSLFFAGKRGQVLSVQDCSCESMRVPMMMLLPKHTIAKTVSKLLPQLHEREVSSGSL
jgi:hypothetical protein